MIANSKPPQTDIKVKVIDKGVLTWARTTNCGYSIEEVIELTGHKDLAKWEAGEEYPTYRQLKDLAVCYERPLAIFFMNLEHLMEEKEISRDGEWGGLI